MANSGRCRYPDCDRSQVSMVHDVWKESPLNLYNHPFEPEPISGEVHVHNFDANGICVTGGCVIPAGEAFPNCATHNRPVCEMRNWPQARGGASTGEQPLCGEVVAHLIAGASWFPCALLKGHREDAIGHLRQSDYLELRWLFQSPRGKAMSRSKNYSIRSLGGAQEAGQ